MHIADRAHRQWGIAVALEYPLAELELTRTGKRKATYAVRSVAVGLAFGAIFFGWLVSMPMSMSTTETMTLLGGLVAGTARTFQFFAVFIVAPLVTAGLVAREKQGRTLGLLLMADMGGRDIFLSKFLAAFLYVELLSLSALPILAIASLLGGISVPAMALQVTLLTVAALAMCAVGLGFSTIANRPTEALFYTILLEAFWLGSTLIADMASFATGLPNLNIAVAAWTVDSPGRSLFDWAPSAGLTLGLAAIATLIAIRMLPRQAHDSIAKGRKRRTPTAPTRPVQRPQTLSSAATSQAAPARKLVWAGAPGLPVFQWPMPLRILTALVLIPLGMFPCVGGLFILVLIVYDITSSLAASRRDGSMDSLFVTPMDNKTLTSALTRTYLHRSLLLLPAILVPGALWGLMRVAQHVFGAMELSNGGLFLGLLPIWLVGLFSGACYLLVPVTRFFLYWAMGCWASTLASRPAGQTMVAAAIGIGVTVGVYIATGIVSGVLDMVVMSVSSDYSSTLVLQGIMAVALNGFTVAVNVGLIVLFRNLFAYQVGTKWRTGISQPVQAKA
ncbi:MAG: ABC transporter permease [bacterium]|nr:ABC transporter permease [bacterium]